MQDFCKVLHMNPRITSAISFVVFAIGSTLIGVGCALTIMPAAVAGVFLVGVGAIGAFFAHV